ncbi:MAG: hypothetical protein LDL15_08135 [Yonghaparkia sp.]|nr:hypothetical protein [Microcella sp.]
MPELVVTSAATIRDDGRTVITTRFSGLDLPPVWLALPEGARPDQYSETDLGNVSLGLGLLAAMHHGAELRVAHPVSARLLESVPEYQAILTTWYPDERQRVAVHAERVSTDAVRGAGEATFFTGGVDSFDTLLRNRSTITALVFVAGFDIPLDRPDAIERTRRHLRAVADATGTELLELETNLRTLFEGVGSWKRVTHGVALGTVALALAPLGFGTVRIASGKSYAQLTPWGSHPMTDQLWSTEGVRVVHDGADAPRSGKIARIAREPLVHQHLRVCWEQMERENCGHCVKCTRTRLFFELNGVGHLMATFPGTITLHRLLDEGFHDVNDVFNARLLAAALLREPRTRAYGAVLDERVRYIDRRHPDPAGTTLPPPDLRDRLALRLARRRARMLEQRQPLPHRPGA